MKAFTDISQSKKLTEILPLESADMCFNTRNNMPPLMTPYSKFNEFFGMEKTPDFLIPCWSLAELLDVLPKGDYKDINLCYGGLTINDYVDEWFCSYQQPEPMVMLHTHADNPVDACYEMILKLNELNLL